MCEPHHSSIQFPDKDDFDNDDDLTGQSSRQAFVGKIGNFFKKIGRFLHISKMAHGHSETLRSHKADMSIHNFVLPSHIKWETNWAHRLIYVDHNSGIDWKLMAEAEKASIAYSNDVSIGGLTQLRRFLTESLTKTARSKLQGYLEVFLGDFLNIAGQNIFYKRRTACFGPKKFEELPRSQLVKFMLGFTRHREFLTTEWADDGKLWLPRKELITSM